MKSYMSVSMSVGMSMSERLEGMNQGVKVKLTAKKDTLLSEP